jgi:threonine/homoserine efflux transporter RhtA
MPADRVGLLGLLSPTVAAPAGWVLLSEALTGVQAAAMALAVRCVVLAQRVDAARARPARHAEPAPAHRGDRAPSGTAPRS